MGLRCTCEVPAVADNVPSLASLPTTPNTSLPKGCACRIHRTGLIETRRCSAPQPECVLQTLPSHPGDPPFLPLQLPGQKHRDSSAPVSGSPGTFPRGTVCGMSSLGEYSLPSARVCPQLFCSVAGLGLMGCGGQVKSPGRGVPILRVSHPE